MSIVNCQLLIVFSFPHARLSFFLPIFVYKIAKSLLCTFHQAATLYKIANYTMTRCLQHPVSLALSR
jgi:hypothetical protein